jgi:hypothetical protein
MWNSLWLGTFILDLAIHSGVHSNEMLMLAYVGSFVCILLVWNMQAVVVMVSLASHTPGVHMVSLRACTSLCRLAYHVKLLNELHAGELIVCTAAKWTLLPYHDIIGCAGSVVGL